MANNNHQKRNLFWLVIIFVVPIIAAWIIFRAQPNLGGTNHGELIQPPMPISELKITTEEGTVLDNDYDHYHTQRDAQVPTTIGKWLLLFFYPDECDQACQQGLYNLRQIRTAVGKERNRIRRAILTYNHYDETALPRLLTQHFDGTLHLIIDRTNYRKVIGNHILKDQLPHYAIQAGTYFIVDPHGNMMMSYRPGIAGKKIFKDLKHLLKASQIG